MVTVLAALDVAVPPAGGSAVPHVPGVAVPLAPGLAVTGVPDVAELPAAEQADTAAKAAQPAIAHAVLSTLLRRMRINLSLLHRGIRGRDRWSPRIRKPPAKGARRGYAAGPADETIIP
jgi:hypothetical protein